MGLIQHCQGKRRAKTYYLTSDLISQELFLAVVLKNPLEFKWIAIHVLDRCPDGRCGQRVLEYHTEDWNGRKGPQHRIQMEMQEDWLKAIHQAMAREDVTKQKKLGEKAIETWYLTSEYSREIKKPVDRVHHKVLARFKEPSPLEAKSHGRRETRDSKTRLLRCSQRTQTPENTS